jgi:LysR family glycine cleavage system transcriptional activator
MRFPLASNIVQSRYCDKRRFLRVGLGFLIRMLARLPPLNALRAFEAAARHMSFARAAAELNVTPAAVSHQIKALEEDLGVDLFHRRNRGLELSEPGRALLPDLGEAFARIRAGVGRVRRDNDGGTLTVTTAPSFAAKWLVLRLHRFAERHPEIDVRLTSSDAIVDLAASDIDVAIPSRTRSSRCAARASSRARRG